MEKVARADRSGHQGGSRHFERLCRAGHRRLLPRHRAGPNAACPLRPDDRDVQNVIVDGARRRAVTTTVEGRERYTVDIRYPRELRSDPQAIAREVLVPLPNGGTVPLGEVAKSQTARRARPAIRTENAPAGRLYLCRIRDRDLGGYVADAQKAVARASEVPARLLRRSGAGSSSICERAKARLKIVVPLTLLIIFLLLYLNFRRITETLIVMLSLPFSLVGGFG